MLTAVILTTLAGLSTGIGSVIALFAKKTDYRFLSCSLGFSAGVMIYVSVFEMFPTAKDILISKVGEWNGTIYTLAAFFAGIFFIGIIEKLIPEKKICGTDNVNDKKLMKSGIYTALAIAIHNFPEGLATFVSAQQDLGIAIPIALAIAIHNIPEGVAVSLPIYYATGDKKKAFFYSFASGLTEPAAAVLGFLLIMPFINDVLYGILFTFVSGIMIYISISELLPNAFEYWKGKSSIYGMVVGMMIMAVSLISLR